MVATINPDASHIWDEAEVYILPKSALAGADIEGSAFEPTSADDDFEALGWLFTGLIDAKKGIPVKPDGEVKEFDAFGYPSYRTKFSKGKLKTGFSALEDNAVTAQIVLPGSGPGKIGIPKDLQFYVLYRTVDLGLANVVRMSLRPALLELTDHSGAVEGEQEMYEFTVHHSPDSNKDIFKTIGQELAITTDSIPAGVVGTPYTFQLTSSGGSGAKTWSKTGTLPTGLTLSSGGLLSGTPSAAGTPSITFKVTDSASPTPAEATKVLTVTVTA